FISLLGPDNAIVLNTTRVANRDLTQADIKQIMWEAIKAAVTKDLLEQGGAYKTGSPVLWNSPFKGFSEYTYKRAAAFPERAERSAVYVATVIVDSLNESWIGKLTRIIQEPLRSARYARNAGTATELADAGVVVDTVTPMGIAGVLNRFQMDLFAVGNPAETIALNFHEDLTASLQAAISSVDGREFTGDPWQVLAPVNKYHPSPEQESLMKTFEIEGHNALYFIKESRSDFFREHRVFESVNQWVDEIVERESEKRPVNREAPLHLRVVTVGVGCNEEAVSLVAHLHEKIEADKLQESVTFQIHVRSVDNPVMRRLLKAQETGAPYPLRYLARDKSSGGVPERIQYMFDEVNGALQLKPQFAAFIDYGIYDVRTPPDATIAGQVDIVISGNSFYFASHEVLAAIQNLRSHLKPDGYLAVFADKMRYPNDQYAEFKRLAAWGQLKEPDGDVP
ncbi:MAG: hypothetical protein KDD62_04500, partial [Bdellovibrionales bacterium]|nr:hypothetical protein [Bdellovibrionales bacterium]